MRQSQSRHRVRWKGMLRVLTAVLVWALPGFGFAQEADVVEAGRRVYAEHCANCHGDEGKGDGSIAKLLTITSVDLSQLSKKNAGEFPFWRVYRVIDGRQAVRGHGTREMPVWGAVFQTEAGSRSSAGSLVRGRILELVYYLQSIQDK